ncbi:hypothetical protein DK871_00320 [Pseudomonas sp. L13]|nr:hypothetical protein [Pseudomonas sp. L13]
MPPSHCATILRLQTVGASWLAKNVNDYGAFLIQRGALAFFASQLAPTGRPGQFLFIQREVPPWCTA